MARVIYVNGVYAPYADAAVHVEDRGFQFADGVYEVCEVRDGCLVDERRHMLRLQRSLSELRMAHADGFALTRRDPEGNGPAEPREERHRLSSSHARCRAARFRLSRRRMLRQALFAWRARLSRAKGEKKAAAGISVITLPDIRWTRVDIKTTGLLAQSLARQQAKDAGADEAWMVDEDGFVTEGASCNAWIVTTRAAIW